MSVAAPLQACAVSKKHALSAERRSSALFMGQQCTPRRDLLWDEFESVVSVARNYDQTWRPCARSIGVLSRCYQSWELIETAGQADATDAFPCTYDCLRCRSHVDPQARHENADDECEIINMTNKNFTGANEAADDGDRHSLEALSFGSDATV
jgi:hypothetical protein